eukprot:1040800-Rhodomonas_salina.1
MMFGNVHRTDRRHQVGLATFRAWTSVMNYILRDINRAGRDVDETNVIENILSQNCPDMCIWHKELPFIKTKMDLLQFIDSAYLDSSAKYSLYSSVDDLSRMKDYVEDVIKILDGWARDVERDMRGSALLALPDDCLWKINQFYMSQ